MLTLFIENVNISTNAKENEVEVSNTLSSNSALLLAVAMFDVALGIGVITYVKKSKIEK